MIEEIKKYDKEFNEDVFIGKVDRIFIMILDAIMERNILNIKHYINEEIYNRYTELVNSYNEKNVIRIFDEMNVKSTKIENYEVKDNCIYVDVVLISRYMDYYIDAKTGDYISGVNTHRIEEEHKIRFVKKLNSKNLGVTINCPTCGNSLNVNDSGLCLFCKNVIDMSEYDYVIDEIDL